MTGKRCDCIPGLGFLRGRTLTRYQPRIRGIGGECPPVESGSKVRAHDALYAVHCYPFLNLSPPSLPDAYLALERLETYRKKLNRAEDEDLKKALDRAIAAIRSKLFQALLGKWRARGRRGYVGVPLAILALVS